MNTVISQLIYDLIYYKTKLKHEEVNCTIKLLTENTSKSFGDDVETWIDWFLSEPFNAHEKQFIRTASRLYKIHLKIKSID